MGVGLKGLSNKDIELMESESNIPGLWTLEKAVNSFSSGRVKTPFGPSSLELPAVLLK